MRKVSKVEQTTPTLQKKKKVAAYARVSKESERLMHSVSAQISYYSSLIQKNPDWEYVGVYSDEGITGTSTDARDGFKRLIEDCENGKIDIILTKSISRFARNTVDLLKTVRHLRDIGVSVRFEKERIDSMSGDGELMLSILASMAQAESESTSQNIKWAKKKQAERGMMTNTAAPFGFRCEDRQLVIIPEQAEVVRRIFTDYTENGLTCNEIANQLNEEGVPAQRGDHWQQCTVRRMLMHEAYVGDLLLLKYYTENVLEHRKVRNKGEREMYLVEDAHEAIVSRETFQKAHDRLKRDGELGRYANKNVTWNEFTEKIVCKGCGRTFGRMKTDLKTGRVPSWSCKRPGGKCMTPSILESELQEIFCRVTGADEYRPEDFEEKVERIEVSLNDVLTFIFKDGKAADYQFIRRKASPLKTRRQDTTALAGRIMCRRCGGAFGYRSQKGKHNRIGYWRCKECGGFSMRDDDLKDFIAGVMETDAFDETAFTDAVDHIEASPGEPLTLCFKDGTEKSEEWNPPCHRGVRWTEERRRSTSEKMKKLRKERGREWQR